MEKNTVVKDILIGAMQMLNLEDEADALKACSGDDNTPLGIRFLRFYNLVISEIAEEYRRITHEDTPVATSVQDAMAEFDGISARLLAYGVATEYCITEGLDEAVTWDNRYRTALAMSARPTVRIKARKLF